MHAQRACAVLQEPRVHTLLMKFMSTGDNPQILSPKDKRTIYQNNLKHGINAFQKQNAYDTWPSMNSSRQMAQTGLDPELLLDPRAPWEPWDPLQPGDVYVRVSNLLMALIVCWCTESCGWRGLSFINHVITKTNRDTLESISE